MLFIISNLKPVNLKLLFYYYCVFWLITKENNCKTLTLFQKYLSKDSTVSAKLFKKIDFDN